MRGKPPTQMFPRSLRAWREDLNAGAHRITQSCDARRARRRHRDAFTPDHLALEARVAAGRDNEDFAAKPVPAKADDRSPTKADHSIACTPESEVHRNVDGSIDIAFYKKRAQRLRREATLKLSRSIREFTRAWFWKVRKSTSKRPRRLPKIAMTKDCCKQENKEENYDA